MKKVTLVVASWCPICPSAKKLWKGLKAQYDFEYEEVDVNTLKGEELVNEHSITSVPTTIIDGKITFVGLPEKDRAVKEVGG